MSKSTVALLYLALFFVSFFGLWLLNEMVLGIPAPSMPLSLIATALLLCFVALAHLNKKKYRPNEEHGSAKWGTKRDAKNYMAADERDNIILSNTEFLTIHGRLPQNKRQYARNKNVLVVGGSGSGKTYGYVKPNLMQCDSAETPVSMVITDPKGTVLEECGQLLIDMGYEIKVINTSNMGRSMGYNPFDYIKQENDILTFVETFMKNTNGDGGKGGGGDDFWVKAERMLYQALMGYMFYELRPEYRTMGELSRMLKKMEASEDDENAKDEIDILFLELEHGKNFQVDGETGEIIEGSGENPRPEHFALLQYRSYKQAAGKTAKSILISCGARLSVFDIKEVRELMSTDEMEFDKLGGYWGEGLEPKMIQKIVRQKDPKTGKLVTKKVTRIVTKQVKVPDKTTAGRIINRLHQWRRKPLFKKYPKLADLLFIPKKPATVTTEKLVREPVMKVARDQAGKPIMERPIIKAKHAYFIIIPDTNPTYNFIVSIMYTQLFATLVAKADNEFKGRLPVHVRFILDEFANSVTRSQVKSLGIGLV